QGHTFGDRTEPAERVTAGRDLRVRVLDEGDDVLLLVRGQLAVRELGHVLGPGEHGLVDLLLAGRVERWRILTRGECAAPAGEVVAGRAVQPEELRAAGDLLGAGVTGCAAEALLGDLAVGVADELGPAAVGIDVGGERVDLMLVVARLLARRLGLVVARRHPAGMHLEVRGSLTGTDERRPAVLDALQVRAVAGDAGDVVDRLALLDEGGLVLLRRGDLRVGDDGSGDSSGAEEAGGDDERAGRLPSTLGGGRPARGPLGLRRRHFRGGWVR